MEHQKIINLLDNTRIQNIVTIIRKHQEFNDNMIDKNKPAFDDTSTITDFLAVNNNSGNKSMAEQVMMAQKTLK